MTVEVAPASDLVAALDRDGFAVIRGALDVQQDIAPVIAENEGLLDWLASRWHHEGKLTSTWSTLPFAERLIQIAIESPEPFIPYFEIAAPHAEITETTPIHLGPAIFNLLRSPRVLDIVEQVIGPEIFVSPMQHIRMKLPHGAADEAIARNGLFAGTTGWHQDLGAVLPEADRTPITTVWIPITSRPRRMAACWRFLGATEAALPSIVRTWNPGIPTLA